MRNDWTPPPLPSDEQIDRAAADLLHIAELEPLRRGGVTFHRDDLPLLAWWDTEIDGDWNCSLDEVAVDLSSVYIDDDDVSLRLTPEQTRRHNLARCRTAVVQAVERCDQAVVLMGESIREADARRALAVLPGGSNR